MKRVRRMACKTRMWTAEKMSGFIFEKTGHRYDISHVRKLKASVVYEKISVILPSVADATTPILSGAWLMPNGTGHPVPARVPRL